MSTLEVIHLRLAGEDLHRLTELVRVTAADATGFSEVLVYRHARIEGDLLIHLRRPGAERADAPSELGLRLASLLKPYGMVEHSVWVRQEVSDTNVRDVNSGEVTP